MKREDVVPAAGVEPAGVLAQLVEDLLHLERGRECLDQHGGPERAARDPERLLRDDEHLVPEPRLEVALHLRQVEVRAGAAVEPLAGVVEDVEPEVEERARTSAVPSTVTCFSGRCQPRGPHQQHRDLGRSAGTACPRDS